MLHTQHKCNNSEMAKDSTGGGCNDEWPKPKKSKTEEIAKAPDWGRLPTIILDNIFQYVTFKDIINASSTCRHWRKSLYHPRCWQHVNFVIEPETIPQVQYFRTSVGHIVTEATVKVNSMTRACVSEFLLLLEYFTYNNNLQSLVLEPSHCLIYTTENMIKVLDTNPSVVSFLEIIRNRPMTKLTLGCHEDLQQHLPNILKQLGKNKPEKVTTLGLASVKEDPANYLINHCDPHLFLPFQSLQILSIDYDILNDAMLDALQGCRNLTRLVVHMHGIWEGHPGTSEEAWKSFKIEHPQCLLRLSLIHAFDEVAHLHDQILKDNMPLSHLKVLFCESMNREALEKLVKYRNTFVSLMWVDSISNSGSAFSLLNEPYYTNIEEPHNLILLSWQCRKLEEIIILGYKFFDEDWIGIAKLRNNTLKKLEIADVDILESGCDIAVELPIILGKNWAALKQYDLHPVLLDPTCGDSDEYLMPILLADLQ